MRWCVGTAVASLDATDHVVRISGVTVDITDRKEAEERQALLAREVDHRARNALALVQSIVRLTRADTIKSYIAAVEGRIGALSRAHTLLAQSRWNGADLHSPTRSLHPIAPATPTRSWSADPTCRSSRAPAQTLALALHELSTNAAKYGALSVLSGRVQLTWELKPERLLLRWAESGGPAVVAPASPGFGIRVIGASVERQLEGERSSTGTRKGCIARFRSRAVTRSARSRMTGRDGGRTARTRRAFPSSSPPATASCWSRTRSWSP